MKCICVLVSAAALAAFAQAPDAPSGAAPAGFGGMRQSDPDPKPYEKVITKEAKSKQGIFTVHTIKSKTYYEIPKQQLDKQFLWVSQIARTTLGAGYGGQAAGNHVVRWELHNNRVLLRSVSHEIAADPKLPISKAVAAANNDTILMAFNVEALAPNGNPVIDVGRLFTTEVTEFSARTRLRARGFDAARSFLESVKVFPQNIEVEATHTYTAPPDTATGMPSAPRSPVPGFMTGMRPGSATVLMHYSMVKLPDNPMQPRIFDPRVGYFTVRQQDFGQDEHRAPQRTYITRWRLEKKDPAAAISDPVKPITYWVDPATPAKWVPYVKSGIEAWQPAFEAAGFRNGIVAKEAPSPEQDPDWSAEDARYSVVRWLPSTIENAVGPHIHDPRTGEILDSDIQFYHNVMQLAGAWYFTQASPNDARARKMPLPDDLMGKLIEYVVAHEVGHTLGFQHNMKASSLYPLDKVRDPQWVKSMGHTPTLMDYSRFNYVAQPEDKIDPVDLIPKIGPYDKWATMWGYKPILSASSAEGEKAVLDEWAREQDKTPWLRFSTAGSNGSDPGENTEAVGDADAVKATELGLKNLNRVMGYLLEATTTRKGETYDDLANMYGRVLGQWSRELGHVAALVGGFDSQQKNIGQTGVRFTPVSRERQVGAVAFLNANAFSTPAMLIRPEILRRMEPSGELNRIRAAQISLLNNLLAADRIDRLTEQEAMDGAKAYKAVEFLADVRKGIWKELDAPQPLVDAYRRNLQRGYLEVVNDKVNGRTAAMGEQRALFRGELRTLSTQIATVLARTADRTTRLHLEDARDQIAKILDPKFQPTAPQTAANPFARTGADESCWPEY